jgi:hypothetical protein
MAFPPITIPPHGLVLCAMHSITVPFPPYARYTNDELLRAYAAGPARLAEVVHGVPEEALLARARGPDTWSIQEIVLHVADSEIQGAYRVRKAWAEPGAIWPVYDQDVWTPVLGHQHAGSDARAVSLDLYAGLRRATLPLFERAEPADWRRANGVHPNFGRITLRDLLSLYADHGERHVDQILAIRKLIGLPLAYDLMLTERLF